MTVRMSSGKVGWTTGSDPNPSKPYNFWIKENDDHNDFEITFHTNKASGMFKDEGSKFHI